MSAEIEQQRQAWCEPISTDAFCGAPTRYEPEYEQLLEEMQKLESIHGEECDWSKVYLNGDILTRTKTKDMTVLGALCIAALRVHGLERFTAAVGAYVWLIENHSEGMFPVPKRQRGRSGAYTWFTEQLIKVIEADQLGAADHETLVLSLQYFNQLYGLMSDQLGSCSLGSSRSRTRSTTSSSRKNLQPRRSPHLRLNLHLPPRPNPRQRQRPNPRQRPRLRLQLRQSRLPLPL